VLLEVVAAMTAANLAFSAFGCWQRHEALKLQRTQNGAYGTQMVNETVSQQLLDERSI
jgi:hypothetical protein